MIKDKGMEISDMQKRHGSKQKKMRFQWGHTEIKARLNALRRFLAIPGIAKENLGEALAKFKVPNLEAYRYIYASFIRRLLDENGIDEVHLRKVISWDDDTVELVHIGQLGKLTSTIIR